MRDLLGQDCSLARDDNDDGAAVLPRHNRIENTSSGAKAQIKLLKDRLDLVMGGMQRATARPKSSPGLWTEDLEKKRTQNECNR